MSGEKVELIDAELRQAYIDFTDKFVVNENSLQALRSGGGMSKPPPLPDTIETFEVNAGSVQGLVYRPKSSEQRSGAGIVWYHGGGFLFGKPGIHQLLYIRLVEALNITVFAPAYRLAPEHAFPAAHDDAFAAWKWFATEGISEYKVDASKIALGGTSAGGGLAFGVALRARDEGFTMPNALLGNIPFFSATYGDSLHKPVLEKAWGRNNVAYAHKWYTPPGTADPHKYAWVHEHSSFRDLPPTSISIADLDTLRDAALDVAARIIKESVNGCEVHIWRGAFHGSVSLRPQAEVSLAQDNAMISFVKRVVMHAE